MKVSFVVTLFVFSFALFAGAQRVQVVPHPSGPHPSAPHPGVVGPIGTQPAPLPNVEKLPTVGPPLPKVETTVPDLGLLQELDSQASSLGSVPLSPDQTDTSRHDDTSGARTSGGASRSDASSNRSGAVKTPPQKHRQPATRDGVLGLARLAS